MKWVLLIVSIIFGYLFSQILNSLFVYYFYIGKRADSVGFLPVITIAFFLIVGIATGFLISLISRQLPKVSAFVVAGLVFLVTLLNIYLDVAAEPLSHKLIVIFVLVPAIIFGSYINQNREP